MGKGEMGTARVGKPPSLPRELIRTPLVPFDLANQKRCEPFILCNQLLSNHLFV
jgi:hypothetical protein